jgi:hypothetical protein
MRPANAPSPTPDLDERTTKIGECASCERVPAKQRAVRTIVAAAVAVLAAVE